MHRFARIFGTGLLLTPEELLLETARGLEAGEVFLTE